MAVIAVDATSAHAADAAHAARRRLAVLDAARGVAAFAVLLFHIWGSHEESTRGGIFDAIARWGWVGVPAFFAISGYVIASSTARLAGPRDACRFLVRRYLRVGVPLVVAAGVAWCAWWASATFLPTFRGMPTPQLDLAYVGCHVTATCDFAGIDWINSAFWTLAVEFQFYLLWAFVIAWRRHAGSVAVFTAIGGLLTIAPFAPKESVALWSPIFLIGLAGYVLPRMTWSRTQRALLIAPLLAFSAFVVDFASMLAAVVVVLLAWRAPPTPRALLALGAISYSLYLVHTPILARVFNGAARITDVVQYRVLVDLVAILVSLGAAWVFYRVVERPALALSHRVGTR